MWYISAQIIQQIQRVDTLVDHAAAASSFQLAAPGLFVIVSLAAEPGYKAAAADDLAIFAAIDDLFQFNGGAVQTILQADADLDLRMRSHVESLSRLPEFQKETAAQDAEQAEPAAEESEPAAAAQPQAADVQEPEAEPAQPAQEDAEPAAVVEDDDDKAADSSEDFWAKDESQLKLDPPPAPPADFKPDEPDYDAFQGVKFSE